MNYILDQLDGNDVIIKFRDIEAEEYTIDIKRFEDYGIGGTELLVYSFLLQYAFEYWDKEIETQGPAGDIYIEMDLHDFVKVTGCKVSEIRDAIQILNQDRWVRVVKVNRPYGERFAFHATI